GMTSGCPGSIRASAAAAHTRTKLSESRNASVRGATASRAMRPISASACAARRRSSESLLFSAATQPAVTTPRYDGCPADIPSSGALSGLALQSTVQVKRGADQSHVRERLREVAQRLARRSCLLGVQPQVVGVGKHLLENEARLLHPTCARQRLDQPECTHIE